MRSFCSALSMASSTDGVDGLYHARLQRRAAAKRQTAGISAGRGQAMKRETLARRAREVRRGALAPERVAHAHEPSGDGLRLGTARRHADPEFEVGGCRDRAAEQAREG